MAITQNPASQVKIGYGSFSYTGYCLDGLRHRSTADLEPVICEGDEITTIIKNKAQEIDFDAVIKEAGSLTPPELGSQITLNSVIYLVTAAEVSYTDGASRLSISCRKPDVITYT